MREIKFRAWDKEKKEWYKPIHEVYKGNLSELMLGFKGDILEHNINGITHESVFPDRYELNQYTGLKDKNGVEIYEGDIVMVKTENTSFPTKVEYWVSEGAYMFCKNKWSNFQLDAINHGTDGLKIIGNIYENPELLSK